MIVPCHGRDHVAGAVAAVIVDYEDFVDDVQRVEHAADVIEQAAYVAGFAQRRNHQRQLERRGIGLGDASASGGLIDRHRLCCPNAHRRYHNSIAEDASLNMNPWSLAA